MKIKKVKKILRLFVLDTESNNPVNLKEFYQWKAQKKSNFSLGILRGWNSQQTSFFVDVTLMWAMMKRKAKLLNTLKTIFFCQNLKWDITFFWRLIIKECVEVVDCKESEMADYTFKQFYQADRNSRVLYILIKYPESAIMELRCTLGMFNHMKLANIGKVLNKVKAYQNKINLLKGTIDYSIQRKFNSVVEAKIKDPEFVQYGEQDVLILLTALKDPELKQLFGSVLNRTVSSYAFKDLDKKCADAMLTNYQHEVLDSDDFSWLHAGYHGGLTLRLKDGLFDPNKIYENVWYTDITSSYPYRMWQGLPMRRRKSIVDGVNTQCFENNCQHYLTVWIKNGVLKPHLPTGIWNIRWRDGNFKLRENDKNDYYYHPHIFEGECYVSIMECEWEELKKWYDFEDYQIQPDFIHFEVVPIKSIRVYIEALFKIKNNIDKEQYPALYLAIKGKINALYGQLGMTGEGMFKHTCEVIKKDGVWNYFDEEHNKWNTLSKDANVYYNQCTKKHYFFKRSFHISDFLKKDMGKAVWITSQARLSVMKIIRQNCPIWIYSDTDCCFTLQKPKLPLDENFGNNLGDWSPPVVINYGKFLEPKLYVYWTPKEKIVCKVAGRTDLKIQDWLNSYLENNHHPKCVISNFTEENIECTKTLKSRTYEYGSVLLDVSKEKSPVYRCCC